MASTNQSPQYQKAQAMFLQAVSNEDKLRWLEEMIRECPKHKSAEAMLANLKTRRKKLLEKIESLRKSSRGSGKSGIKKEEMQAAIIGFSGSGKSSLLRVLTNAQPEIAPYRFTTKHPIVGMMGFFGTQVQIVEVPAIESEYYDRSIVHTTDTIIILVSSIEEINKVEKEIGNVKAEKIIVFNNKEDLNERKIDSTLKSKKLNYVLINTDTEENISELKEKIFKSFGKIRVFTKEPSRKTPSEKPIILSSGSNVKDVAEKIFHGFSKRIKETFVTGPSSKFPNQKVGLNHVLKDMDVVEFRTR